MNQMLVAVFDTETAAFEGLSALRDLHKQGGISLYASAVVVKDKTGRARVKQEVEYGPAGTALGLLTGSLLGILGGPAGLAAGASLGGITGLLFDLNKIVVGATFLDDVSKTLTGQGGRVGGSRGELDELGGRAVAQTGWDRVQAVPRLCC